MTRRYNEMEKHVLGVVNAMPTISAMRREKLCTLCADMLLAPEQGFRDSRLARVSISVTDLCNGKDAPLREIDGVVHFLVFVV